MKNFKTVFPAALALLVSTQMGCSSQATPDYEGESLLDVQGSVSGAVASGGSVDAALAWAVGLGPEYVGLVSRVGVQGSFPQKFSLAVMAPPPSSSLVDPLLGSKLPYEGKVAAAWIVAIPSTFSEGGAIPPASLAGAAPGHFIFYNERAFGPGSVLAGVFGGQISAGYHLMTARPYNTEEMKQIDACKANALATNGDPKPCQVTRLKIEPATQNEQIELKLGPGAADLIPDL
ncbi:MAG: hypothetical protein KBF88_12095 [Polyangiaceae bacterium]|nr:hypothetical protein [Polyangiaceae bacterium]